MKRYYEWRVLSDDGILDIVESYFDNYGHEHWLERYPNKTEAEKALENFLKVLKSGFQYKDEYVLVEIFKSE